jgi:hypothetical protein
MVGVSAAFASFMIGRVAANAYLERRCREVVRETKGM